MLRRIVCALFVLTLSFGIALADEYKGKIKSVDDKSLTITVDGKDVKVDVSDSTAVVAGKDGKEKPVKGGLKSLKEGAEVFVKTEKKDNKEVATQIKVAGKKKDK
jgi:Cu/Ag efflux protein CusF